MWRVAIVICLWSASALADDLPPELLLKCDMNQKVKTTYVGGENSNEASLQQTLRLKSGSLMNVENGGLEGADCALKDGQVLCKLNRVRPILDTGRTSKEQSTVVLSRSTGEISIAFEQWGYEGSQAVGKPTSHLLISRTGICRSVGKAVF
ncbi:hypothetical protein QWJ07_03845 [Frankia sp. RB7]|nr:hypothetical protein [Frankia sp. RB7]